METIIHPGFAATAVEVIDLSARVISLCLEYVTNIENAEHASRLQTEVLKLEIILKEVQSLLNGPDGTQFVGSRALRCEVDSCFLQLINLETKLESGRRYKVMGLFGVRTLKWPFENEEVERIVMDLGRCQNMIYIGLEVNQTSPAAVKNALPPTAEIQRLLEEAPRNTEEFLAICRRANSDPVEALRIIEQENKGLDVHYWVRAIKCLVGAKQIPSKVNCNEEGSDVENCMEISGPSDASSMPWISNTTDAKTSFSKDSGYISMVSKPQSTTPHNGQGANDSAKWESRSVASVRSLATMDTVSSVNPAAAGGAAEELAETLVEDDSICCLIVKGYESFDSNRFERNFSRILKNFALSLRKEAQNDLERSAVRLVYNYRAYVIRLIRKRLALVGDEHATTMDELLKQKTTRIALERFLEQLPGAEGVVSENAGEDNDSASENDSDFSNDEQPSLPNLEKVKLYLLSSTAYSELKQQLTDFVRPSNITTTTLDDDENSQARLNARSDDSNSKPDVRERDSHAEDCNFLEPLLSNPKLEANYQQSESSSAQCVQFAWDAGHRITQQATENQSLEEYDLSKLHPVPQETSNCQKSLETVGKTNHLQKLMIIEEEKELLQSPSEEAHLRSRGPRNKIEEVLRSLNTWAKFAINPNCASQMSLRLPNWWIRFRRKPVAENHSRIEWKCPCGHDLYADFSSKSQDMLDKYTAILKTTPSNSGNHAAKSSANTLTPPLIAHLHSTNSSRIIGQTTTQGASSLTPSCTSRPAPSMNANNSSNPSFLELCVNTGAHLKSLGEIDLTHISTDGALFKAVKHEYLRLRGFRSTFWLLTPTTVSFVRFSLENRYRVGILQKPLALPPKSEVDAKKWIYSPCPLDGDPPIAEDLFLHYLQCSEGPSTLFWMLRFPRKLETSLIITTGTSPAFGWGIHIDEGPDFAAIFLANFVVLLLSGVTALIWTVFKHDFQGAFGFGCWIIAVLNSLLIAYMFKWRQE